MASLPPTPALHFFTRADCELCDDARAALQAVLEQRARRGDPVPRLQVVDVDREEELSLRYGARVPVVAIGDQELSLATSARAIAAFLDRVMGRLA